MSRARFELEISVCARLPASAGAVDMIFEADFNLKMFIW
jgi:hypothetical protein